MASHSASTVQHQINDSNLTYANETALLAATPAASLIGRVGYATSENTYWLLIGTGPTSWVQLGGGGASAPLDLTEEDAVTAAVTDPLTVGHNSTGTPAAGFGTGITFQAESSTTPDTFIGSIEYEWTVATHASRASQLMIYAGQNDAASGKQLLGVIRTPNDMTSFVEGNARGEASIEIQPFRNAATEVASGAYATIIGGSQNTCSGQYGAGIFGGIQNTVSQNGSVIMGGWNNTISGYYGGIIGGERASISSDYTIAIANARFGISGAAQSRIVTLHAFPVTSHTDTTWYTITSQYGGTLAMPTDSNWNWEVDVIGLTSGAAQRWNYHARGGAYNDAGTITVTVGPSGYENILESDPAYEMQVTNSGTDLIVQVRRNGGTDYNVRWVAAIRTVEVIYG